MLDPKGISDINRDIILEKIKKLIELNKLNEISMYFCDSMEARENETLDKKKAKLNLKCKSLCLARTMLKRI